MTRSVRGEALPDFKQQMGVAGKLDAVDPTVAKLITQSGLSDGDASDDKVSVSRKSWPASKLKPSQTSMVLPKALGMALFMLKKGKVGGDLGALVSKDGHILDGHHRWAATILASGNKGQVGGYGANLPGKELLKVLNVVSKGMFNVRGGKAGKGALSQFTEGNVRSMLQDFTENGIGGEFPWSPDDVKQVLEANFGSVEEGITAMANNASLITTTVPGWAPDRKQMPVIEPEQVPGAANALSKGEVDWNDPHRKEGSLRGQLIRVAQTLPKGSEDRRAVLRLAAEDKSRAELIKKASALPKGSEERRVILSSLVAADKGGKPGDFQEGDIVRHTGKFLRNTGMGVGAPINGKVVKVNTSGFTSGWPVVEWSDGGGPSPVNPVNLEFDPRHRR